MAYVFREFLHTELMFAVRIECFLMDECASENEREFRCDNDQLERKVAEVGV